MVIGDEGNDAAAAFVPMHIGVANNATLGNAEEADVKVVETLALRSG